MALLLTTLGASTGWAAKKKSRAAQPRAQETETYSAIDHNPMEASASAVSLPTGQSAGIAQPNPDRPTPPSLGNVLMSDAAATAVAAKWQSAPFDPIPAAQADSIARRLKLVEELLRKHGRAYDYRTLTLKDLESILAYLEEESSRNEVYSQ